MNETQYLSVEAVVGLHDAALDREGCPFSPLLHPEKLESAVARCRNVAHYEGADLIRQAVILAVSISQSQAFLDGNKRAAFAAADVFLRINGLVYRPASLEIALHLEAVAEANSGRDRDEAVDHFTAWLRERVVSVASPINRSAHDPPG